MIEKPSIYNEDGQVINSDIARKMAEVEAPYHEKTLGFLNPSERKIRRGERRAEELMEEGEVIKKIKDIPEAVLQTVIDKYPRPQVLMPLGSYGLTSAKKVDYEDGIVIYKLRMNVNLTSYPIEIETRNGVVVDNLKNSAIPDLN